jgi:hypothetical protein
MEFRCVPDSALMMLIVDTEGSGETSGESRSLEFVVSTLLKILTSTN